MNEVFETANFRKVLKKSTKDEQEWVENVKDQLSSFLFMGKPLRFAWLREKKYKNKRLYFIINANRCRALLIAIGKKKEQQAIIQRIIDNKDAYFSMLR
tara:strand:+ start:475 stop:771 length:297 start_codon:yes stop_codon:yes gene_type:complete